MINSPNWDDLRADMEARRRALAAEISAYPGPITGCDAQFNHLTEQRRLIDGEIARLDDLKHSAGGTIADFLQSSPLFGQESKTA